MADNLPTGFMHVKISHTGEQETRRILWFEVDPEDEALDEDVPKRYLPCPKLQDGETYYRTTAGEVLIFQGP